MPTNPYLQYDLDPSADKEAITERFRELMEDATDENTRRSLRAAWEALTLHPKARVAAALRVHPDRRRKETPPPRANPPRSPHYSPRPTLSDLAMRPSVEAALFECERASGRLPLTLDDDPHLAPEGGRTCSSTDR